ncbi:60S ribosomal protein RL27 [Ramicandelaber brevisporus]|nr:60S ribosomal protein RL27 [Ramicandelaber brevisporus]
MVKFLKPGKVVLLLQGRQAGKKAVIIRNIDEGSKERKYGHALVAGVERYPRKVVKSMGAKTLAKRTRVKPFIKYVNYNHIMPTRYGLDLVSLKDLVPSDALKDVTLRRKAKAAVKTSFQALHKEGKNKWFFTKLRF